MRSSLWRRRINDQLRQKVLRAFHRAVSEPSAADGEEARSPNRRCRAGVKRGRESLAPEPLVHHRAHHRHGVHQRDDHQRGFLRAVQDHLQRRPRHRRAPAQQHGGVQQERIASLGASARLLGILRLASPRQTHGLRHRDRGRRPERRTNLSHANVRIALWTRSSLALPGQREKCSPQTMSQG